MTRKAPPVWFESRAGIKLPTAIDEYGTPKTKMPSCPLCDHDELGLIQPDMAYCYACGLTVLRDPVPRNAASA